MNGLKAEPTIFFTIKMQRNAMQEVTTTAEMAAGLAAHAKLEAETSTFVEVAVETPEDAWALKLLNTIQGVHQLLSEGLTRELGVFGYFKARLPQGFTCHWDACLSTSVTKESAELQ